MKARTIKFSAGIEIEPGNWADVEVEATYLPGYPGCAYRSNGDPGDPPEAPEIEYILIRDEEAEYQYDDLPASAQSRLDARAREAAEFQGAM